MLFQLPKPLRGWREFAGEVGIIVLGVLIALGAEQLIRAVHDRREAAQSRANVDIEIGENLDALRRRAAIQGCVDERLRVLETMLSNAVPGELVPQPLWVGRPQFWNLETSRWQAEGSNGGRLLWSTSDQSRYSGVYNSLAAFESVQNIEQSAWAQLRALETIRRYDTNNVARLIAALQDAKYANFRVVVATRQATKAARALRVPVRTLPVPPGSPSACVPLKTTRGAAMRLITAARPGFIEP